MDVYEELGVRPFINAADHYTRFGGSISRIPFIRASDTPIISAPGASRPKTPVDASTI